MTTVCQKMGQVPTGQCKNCQVWCCSSPCSSDSKCLASTTTKKGNKYVVTLVDYFSKWPEAAPLQSMEAAGVALFIYELFFQVWLCEVIISDQGREFVNKLEEKRDPSTHWYRSSSDLSIPSTDQRHDRALQSNYSSYCYLYYLL